MLFRGLRREGVYRFQPGWGIYSVRLLAATAGMVLAIFWLVPDNSVWLAWDWQRRAIQILVVCGAGVVAYIGIHLLLGTRLSHLRGPRHAG